MRDRFGRRIDYLRVSVTDRCNLRCVYCMPEEGYPVMPKAELLTYEEIARLVRVAAGLGMRKIRLTGGEPLVRKDLPELVAQVAATPGIEDISLTTNAYLLRQQATALRAAGLHRVNISLDTLNPEKFSAIARRGDFERVMDGIEAAFEAGFSPVKINAVAMRGTNDDEAADFAQWTIKKEIHFRFIELMPIKWHLDETAPMETFQPHGGKGLLQLNQVSQSMLSDLEMRKRMISVQELRELIEAVHGKLEPAEVATNGPARTFRVPGAKGTVGFISQVSRDLCENCNRLRLTADGFLRPCLMSDGELDLRSALRNGATDDAIAELFLHVVRHKPERHYLAEGQKSVGRGMSQIGG